MRDPRSILITGASSGIGEALAAAYAAPGVTLFLSGRDASRLAGVAAACRSRGARVEERLIDVTQAEAMADYLAACDRQVPLDLVIANAGISGGIGKGEESPEQLRRIFRTNIDGVVNTLLPAIAAMRPRRRGQLAIMASLAAFRGLPTAPAYCASKAALRSWGEGLRGSLQAEGLELSVICPGFVRSPMTAVNRFPMPLLLEAEEAAKIIRKGLEKGRARIAFPRLLFFAVWLLALLPPAPLDALLRRLPAKD